MWQLRARCCPSYAPTLFPFAADHLTPFTEFRSLFNLLILSVHSDSLFIHDRQALGQALSSSARHRIHCGQALLDSNNLL